MNSKFEGKLLGYIGTGLLMSLIIICSLGIATPWAVCIGIRWYTKHTTVDGQKVIFDGTGKQLFGNYVKWILLSIITLFIYSLWIPIKTAKWVVSHLHLEPADGFLANDPYAEPAPQQYAEEPDLFAQEFVQKPTQYAQNPVQQAAPVQASAFARCPYCGKRIFSRANECMHCGAQLTSHK